MSLDVYLTVSGAEVAPGSGIFIREDGQTKEISRFEWDQRFPDREPVVVEMPGGDCVFEWNITHNLNRMADAAGIYQQLWRPEELGITKARQLIDPLRDGLALLQSDPERFRAFNPSNGWGDYEGLLAFVAAYLGACQKWPEAEVRASP